MFKIEDLKDRFHNYPVTVENKFEYPEPEDVFTDESSVNTLDGYQRWAQGTMLYRKGEHADLYYPVLGLNGEAGEVAEVVKKIIRDNEGVVTDEMKERLAKELGDVIWYVSATATELDLKLSDIASMNLRKLYSRKQRNVIHGDGDNR